MTLAPIRGVLTVVSVPNYPAEEPRAKPLDV